MLSDGYEIRRLTGKLDLTGMDGIMSCRSVDLQIAHHDENAWVEYKKCPKHSLGHSLIFL